MNRTEKGDSVFWKSILDALFKTPYLLLVFAFSLCIGLESSWGVFQFNSKELIGLILPISGTIVAFALPMAQLSMDMMTRVEEESLRILARNYEGDPEYVLGKIPEYKAKFTLAWRALLYALLSFLLSIMASLGPFSGSVFLDLLVTASLGSLIVSALLFYPVVRFAFRLEAVDVIIKTANGLVGKPRSPIGPAEPICRFPPPAPPSLQEPDKQG